MKNKNVLYMFLALALLIGFCFYGLNTYSEIKKAELKNSIRYTCGQLYRYTKTLPDGGITSYPMEKEFEDCIKTN